MMMMMMIIIIITILYYDWDIFPHFSIGESTWNGE